MQDTREKLAQFYELRRHIRDEKKRDYINLRILRLKKQIREEERERK